MIDSDGDYESAADKNEALSRYADSIGGDGARRLIKLNLKVSLPDLIEADIEVADDAGETLEAKAS
ncbi:MAG TPA: hypothetical protein VGJ20_04115 [Xanthobacteraceae bacterium]